MACWPATMMKARSVIATSISSRVKPGRRVISPLPERCGGWSGRRSGCPSWRARTRRPGYRRCRRCSGRWRWLHVRTQQVESRQEKPAGVLPSTASFDGSGMVRPASVRSCSASSTASSVRDARSAARLPSEIRGIMAPSAMPRMASATSTSIRLKPCGCELGERWNQSRISILPLSQSAAMRVCVCRLPGISRTTVPPDDPPSA